METVVIEWLVPAAGAAAFAASAWGFWWEPRLLVVREHDLAVTGWPAETPPLRVALLGDIQFGNPPLSAARLEKIVERINAEMPDVVFLLGDFVVGGARWFVDPDATPEQAAAILGTLNAPLGVIAVLGNHDWKFDGLRVERALVAAGITVLENRHVARFKDNIRFCIAGVADDITRAPDIGAALAGAWPGEPTILLAHDPAAFLDVPPGPIVTFAAHTHGGQVRPPFMGPLWVPSRAPRRWAYGLIEEDGRQMYVTSGVGTSMIPVRFNVPPEIAILTLRGAAA